MADPSPSDLVVNGETIPHAAVAAEAQNHRGPRGKPEVAWRRAANALAVRTLLLQEARRRRLAPDPQEIGPGRVETDEEALIRALLDAAVRIDPPSDEEILVEWSRDPGRFRTPPLWEVSHILCACDPRNKREKIAAYMRALDVTRRALADPGSFARLAAAHSDCGSKANGGALGQVGPGDTAPEFEAALRDLSQGEITPDPVLTRYGWHVIRMDAVATGAVLPYDAVRQTIADALEKAAWARAARAFVDRLAAAAEISGADIHSQ